MYINCWIKKKPHISTLLYTTVLQCVSEHEGALAVPATPKHPTKGYSPGIFLFFLWGSPSSNIT